MDVHTVYVGFGSLWVLEQISADMWGVLLWIHMIEWAMKRAEILQCGWPWEHWVPWKEPMQKAAVSTIPSPQSAQHGVVSRGWWGGEWEQAPDHGIPFWVTKVFSNPLLCCLLSSGNILQSNCAVRGRSVSKSCYRDPRLISFWIWLAMCGPL
jgi:hypothetical protein